jgi:hypothetical protein
MKSQRLFTFMLLACLLHTRTVSGEKNAATGTAAQLHNYRDVVNKSAVDSQGESETRNALKTAADSQFDADYKMLLSGETSTKVDLMNDSAEVDDGLNSDAREILGVLPGGSGIDDFLRQNTQYTNDYSSISSKNFKNVYKVPKSKTKKTQPSRSFGHASLNNNPVINDFNPEKLISSVSGSSRNETPYHDFTNLYDHFMWEISSISSLSQACTKEMSFYLKALRDGKDWALKASDASGR